MSDTEQVEAPTKRPPGRPKGSLGKKKRNAVRESQRMPRGITGDDVLSCKTEPQLHTHQDPLRFPVEILWQLEHEWGYVGQWAAFEVMGAPVKNALIRKQQGYQEATRTSFQGLLKPYVPRRDGPIT